MVIGAIPSLKGPPPTGEEEEEEREKRPKTVQTDFEERALAYSLRALSHFRLFHLGQPTGRGDQTEGSCGWPMVCVNFETSLIWVGTWHL